MVRTICLSLNSFFYLLSTFVYPSTLVISMYAAKKRRELTAFKVICIKRLLKLKTASVYMSLSMNVQYVFMKV